jgi:hypothetical protein
MHKLVRFLCVSIYYLPLIPAVATITIVTAANATAEVLSEELKE